MTHDPCNCSNEAKKPKDDVFLPLAKCIRFFSGSPPECSLLSYYYAYIEC